MDVFNRRCCGTRYTPKRSIKRYISSKHTAVVWQIALSKVNSVRSHGT